MAAAPLLVNADGQLKSAPAMTNSDRKEILDLHNEWRNKAAGGKVLDREGKAESAKGLPIMTYDLALEELARAEAIRCKQDTKSTNGYSRNAFFVDDVACSNSDSCLSNKYEYFVDEFAKRAENFKYSDATCTDYFCVQFTNLVNQDSARVGCAYANCNKVEIGNNVDIFGGGYSLHCYYPPNDIMNKGMLATELGLFLKKPYDYGKTGVDCPNGMDKKYGNLCAKKSPVKKSPKAPTNIDTPESSSAFIFRADKVMFMFVAIWNFYYLI